MNRLQKKCFIASAGFHLLLVLILLVGPAFLSAKNKSEDFKVIDFVPSKLVDSMTGGGNPNAKPPPAPPAPTPQPQPQPQPSPEKQRVPDPPKQAVKPEKEQDVVENIKPHKPKLPQVSTKPVVRKNEAAKTTKSPSPTDTKEQEMADAKRRVADLISKTSRSLRSDLSSTTTVDTNYGPGGGGEAYANYAQVVKSIYEHAWSPPEDTASDDAITKVTVTIANDGTVLASRIVRISGDSSVDKSVQRTLDRVTFIAPFPAGAKEKERTYTINFNLKAKRLLG